MQGGSGGFATTIFHTENYSLAEKSERAVKQGGNHATVK